ncbi:MAG: hypothetical protein CMO33_10175 [Verrucomicrobia bacterium]|nr:hypothetical protein [Verrucomicrobiota bacterium]|tara:strand:- start:1839 stop:2438 length:600 start_codon:yes stop_codon:yes gene_type:complete
MLLLDGKRLARGKAFSSNGVSYPANWLELTSRDEHEQIGIVYVADPVSSRTWDQRWAWGYLGNGELNWKDFEDKKQHLLSDNNRTADYLLAPTDYTVIRKYEKGTAIPDDTSSFRDEVRRINEAREAAINATSTTEELYGIKEFADLPYPGSIAEWKATREAAAAAAAAAAAESSSEESSESSSEGSSESSSESSESAE